LVIQVGDRPIIEVARGLFDDVVAVPGGSAWRSELFTRARCHNATAVFESGQITIINVIDTGELSEHEDLAKAHRLERAVHLAAFGFGGSRHFWIG
jgi:hypothetical protein